MIPEVYCCDRCRKPVPRAETQYAARRQLRMCTDCFRATRPAPRKARAPRRAKLRMGGDS